MSCAQPFWEPGGEAGADELVWAVGTAGIMVCWAT